MPTLFIRFLSTVTRDDEGAHAGSEWLIAEDDGSVRAGGVTDLRGLSDLIDPGADWLQNPGNVVVVLPGEHVLAVSCEVPGRSVGQVRRALPYAVEEFVATDIEGMHLASGSIRHGLPVRCNLIDRRLLDDWLECLDELGLVAGFMASEAELLPSGPGQVSVLFEGDTALVKTVDQAATVDRSNLLLALGSVAADELLLINGRLNDMELGQLDGDVRVSIAGDDGIDAESTLGYLAARWRIQTDTINLLQGRYTPNRPLDPNLARWRAVAALAGIWVAVGLVAMSAEAFWASAQADRLEVASEELYRSIYPQERRVINIRRQMSARLGDGRAGSGTGFTGYLGSLAGVLDPTAAVTSLNYTDGRDELAADLLLRGYDDVDRLKGRLEEQGVPVAITSAEQQDSGVRARIRLGVE